VDKGSDLAFARELPRDLIVVNIAPEELLELDWVDIGLGVSFGFVYLGISCVSRKLRVELAGIFSGEGAETEHTAGLSRGEKDVSS
jgi:hypothetical protein